MDFENETNENETVIDWQFLLKSLLAKVWIIVLVAVLVGSLTAVYNGFFVKPKYASTVMLHAENNSTTTSDKVNASDLAAAQSLIDTFIVFLKADAPMELVLADLGYTYDENNEEDVKLKRAQVAALHNMVSAEEITGTEVFTVTVTSETPELAYKIVNAIANTFPEYAEGIKQGSDIDVIEYGKINTNKVSPHTFRNTAMAALLGAIVTAGILALYIIFDDTIRNGDYILATYDAPILSKIPELTNTSSSKGYYSRYGKYGRYGRYGKYAKGED